MGVVKAPRGSPASAEPVLVATGASDAGTAWDSTPGAAAAAGDPFTRCTPITVATTSSAAAAAQARSSRAEEARRLAGGATDALERRRSRVISPGASMTRATDEGGPCGTVASPASPSTVSLAGGTRVAMRSMRRSETRAASVPQGARAAAKAATVGNRASRSCASAPATASSRVGGQSGRSAETGA